MGIFNSLLRTIGFEDENPAKEQSHEADIIQVAPKNESKQQSKNVNVSSLIVYSPKSNNDVKTLVDCLRKGESCIVNLGNLKPTEQTRILDFLSGGVYALGGKINRLQNNLYVVLPYGVNLTTI